MFCVMYVGPSVQSGVVAMGSRLGSHAALQLSQEGWDKPVNAERRVAVFYIGPGVQGQPVLTVAPA